LTPFTIRLTIPLDHQHPETVPKSTPHLAAPTAETQATAHSATPDLSRQSLGEGGALRNLLERSERLANLSSIRFSAEEKVESISSYEHLGPVQKSLLSKAIEAAYEERATEDQQYPDFEIVERHLKRIYEEEERNDDTLTETLRKLTSFHLFPTLSESNLLDGALYEQPLIVDLHALPALRELVAFFIIEKLYRELKSAPEAPIDPKTKSRELRTLLVIDEAHNYLPMNNHFLEKLIREMRSKGLAVVLLSQSPDDFSQRHFDYTELLEFVFVLKCVADKPNQIQKLIRCRAETAKMLAPRLANLQYPECYTKTLTRSGGEYTHMRAAQFHVAYHEQ
jgi:DNA sulfur modification protein DndE